MAFTKNQVLDGLKYSALSRLLIVSFGFATHMLLARVLDETTLGQLYLLTSVLAILNVVGLHGWGSFLVREIPGALVAEDGSKVGRLIRSSVRSVSVVALIVAGILASTMPVIFREFFGVEMSPLTIVVASVLMVVLVFQRLCSDTFRAFHKIGYALMVGATSAPGAAGYGLIACILFVVVLVGVRLLQVEASLEVVLCAMLPGSILALLWGAKTAKAIVPPRGVSERPDGAVTRGLARCAMPFALLTLLQTVATQVENWMVGSLVSVEMVATIGLATRCAVLFFTPVMIIQNTSLSFVSELNARNEIQRYKPQLQTVSFLCMAFFLVVALGFPLMPESLYEWLFGSAYAQIADATYLRMLQFTALGLSGLAFPLIMMSRLTTLACGLLAIRIVAKLLAEYVGAKAFGFLGLLQAGVAVDLAYAILLVCVVRKHFGVWLVPVCHRSAMSGLLKRRTRNRRPSKDAE